MGTDKTHNEEGTTARWSRLWSQNRLGGLSAVAFAICFFSYLTLVDVPDMSTASRATIAFYEEPANAVGPIVNVERPRQLCS